jgi:hypothetical protein
MESLQKRYRLFSLIDWAIWPSSFERSTAERYGQGLIYSVWPLLLCQQFRTRTRTRDPSGNGTDIKTRFWEIFTPCDRLIRHTRTTISISEQGFRKPCNRGGPDLNRAIEGRSRRKTRGRQKNNKKEKDGRGSRRRGKRRRKMRSSSSECVPYYITIVLGRTKSIDIL